MSLVVVTVTRVRDAVRWFFSASCADIAKDDTSIRTSKPVVAVKTALIDGYFRIPLQAPGLTPFKNRKHKRTIVMGCLRVSDAPFGAFACKADI
jgi:hypothetical protein